LRRFGYEVKAAANPDKALDLVLHGEGCSELIVTDITMPHMTGTEMVVQMRNKWPGLRVVFMSGYTEDPLLKSEFSAAPILHKPFDLSDLAETLHAIL
jgi:two-component system cell cycle sensor histidine kinase/response regulator CckA